MDSACLPYQMDTPDYKYRSVRKNVILQVERWREHLVNKVTNI